MEPFAVSAASTELVFDRPAIVRGMQAAGLNVSDILIVGELPQHNSEAVALGLLLLMVNDRVAAVTAMAVSEDVLRDYERAGSNVSGQE